MSNVHDYIPIVIQSIVVLGFVLATLFLVPKLGPKLNSKKKNSNWECGIESDGNARFPISVRYFVVAILFVLFDVEVIFFYPYAVNFHALQLEGLLAVLVFVGFFLTGFIYVLKKGALEWEK
ncbi:MAG: NADH-quinone oxidoreductase subunit A [Crocinitomicaceae bacterium]|nr:NADH-quinone oxidoreductase subunit A [Crocinitomicaceae bacterium]